MTANTPFSEAVAAMKSGDAKTAFGHLRPLLEYPAIAVDDPFAWVPHVDLFAQVAAVFAGAEFGARVKACGDGNDLQALYDVGYGLIDQGLPLVGATFLARADLLAPQSPGIVMELCAALERGGLHAHAVKVLERSPTVLANAFPARYLLGFNALASGDIEAATRAAASLGTPSNDMERGLSETLRAMLGRVSAAREAGQRLDADDLRGWFFVMNQSVLLHLSPHGPEVMRGRYAFVQDSFSMCREGIAKIASLAKSGVVDLPRVIALPERGAEILARATAEVLGVPLVTWPSTEPGLLVAYDLRALDEGTLRASTTRTPGQWLWAHASCWTESFGYAPDFVTFLYQHNVAPWASRMTIDPETRAASQSEPDQRSPDLVAKSILDVHPTAEIEAEVAAGDFARLSRALPPPRGEPRLRLRDASPVKSARFT